MNTGTTIAKPTYGLDQVVRPVIDSIGAQMACDPDATAVRSIDGYGELTYGELAARSAAIAHELALRGIGKGARVGLVGRRTPGLVASLVGILRAGAAYVPIDPGVPASRLADTLRTAGVEFVLTDVPDQVPAGRWEALCWDVVTAGATTIEPDRRLEDAAYVLFTSGSSGTPKGVVVTDGNLAAYAGWAANAYGFTSGGRTLVHSPITFDFTVTTLICPLMRGGVVELLADDSPAALLDVLRNRKGYDVVKLTPAHLQLIGRQLDRADLEGIARTVVIGGEALYCRQVSPWQRADATTTFVNEYGPTEATVGCCVYWLPARSDDTDAPVPIGGPIAGVGIHVVDREGRPVEGGEVGEIWVSGPTVADGYLGAGPHDADRFRTHGEWGRVYATGDLARETAEGLVYLGRADDQIKIRGHRIELAEVEAAIAACGAVRAVVVSAPQRRGGHDRRLMAHVVAEGDPVAIDFLRAEVSVRLPDYMVPASWMWVDELPLTPNGKVDRRALPLPGRERPLLSSEAIPPADGLEQSVASICAEVLELSALGVHDDLLSLGADSLILAELSERLEALLATTVPLERLFEEPTVAAIATFVRAGSGSVSQ